MPMASGRGLFCRSLTSNSSYRTRITTNLARFIERRSHHRALIACVSRLSIDPCDSILSTLSFASISSVRNHEFYRSPGSFNPYPSQGLQYPSLVCILVLTCLFQVASPNVCGLLYLPSYPIVSAGRVPYERMLRTHGSRDVTG